MTRQRTRSASRWAKSRAVKNQRMQIHERLTRKRRHKKRRAETRLFSYRFSLLISWPRIAPWRRVQPPWLVGRRSFLNRVGSRHLRWSIPPDLSHEHLVRVRKLARGQAAFARRK